MAAIEATPRLLPILHYVAPFAILGYFFAASLWSITMLQTDGAAIRPKLKTIVILGMILVVFTFWADAAVVTSQIFSHGGIFATQDHNVYAWSGALVWIVLAGSAMRAEKHPWYPYWGAWAMSGAIDIATGALELRQRPTLGSVELSQVIIRSVRLLGNVFLFFVVALSRRSVETGNDEETTPLLSKPASSDAEGDMSQGQSAESTVQNRIDHEAQRRQKERDKKMNNMQERLREDGNWFSYARRFSVFWPHLWPTGQPRLLFNMAGVAICLGAERVLNILGPSLLGTLVDDLNAALAKPAFISLALYLLVQWANSYAAVRGLRAALWIPVESNARASLDKKSFNHIMELSCDFHDEKQDGELFAAMRQGVSIVNLLETLLYDLAPTVTDLVLALGYFWFLFDSYLVLIAATTMVAYFWSTLFITNYQVTMSRKLNAMYRQRFGYLHDTMGQWRTVVYFNRIPHVEQLYAATVTVFNKMWRKVQYISHGGHAAQSLVLDLGSFAAFSFAVYQVMYGGASVGSFMTLLTYWGNFSGPLTYLSGTHREILHDLVDAEELRTLFEMTPSVADGPNELHVDQAEVIFKNVSFSYEKEGSNIKNLDLRAGPGQTIALIGETGAGKSTLLKLLFRFYDVQSGSIEIDGQDIRNVTLGSLRECIGVVPQEPNLFNDSIMANLRFGKLDVTREEAIEACKAAAIHDQIERFANGYDSIVGERGVKLSGGERQRVAIARTILKNPKLILLDEATSSVDNETEEKIQTGLAKLCAGRTTIVIAHRLSTIMDADLIVVIKDGTILEQGTPRELLQKKGKYHSLWSKQMGIIDALAKQDEIENLVGIPASPQTTSLVEDQSEDNISGDTETGMPKISLCKGTESPTEAHSRELSSHTGGASRLKFRPDAPSFVPGSQFQSDIGHIETSELLSSDVAPVTSTGSLSHIPLSTGQDMSVLANANQEADHCPTVNCDAAVSHCQTTDCNYSIASKQDFFASPASAKASCANVKILLPTTAATDSTTCNDNRPC